MKDKEMKKTKYTRKQITEAISHWKHVLKTMNEAYSDLRQVTPIDVRLIPPSQLYAVSINEGGIAKTQLFITTLDNIETVLRSGFSEVLQEIIKRPDVNKKVDEKYIQYFNRRVNEIIDAILADPDNYKSGNKSLDIADYLIGGLGSRYDEFGDNAFVRDYVSWYATCAPVKQIITSANDKFNFDNDDGSFTVSLVN